MSEVEPTPVLHCSSSLLTHHPFFPLPAMSPSICNAGAVAHIRALQGTSKCLQPDEGHRDIYHCWRRAQEDCPSLVLGSAMGLGLLVQKGGFLSQQHLLWLGSKRHLGVLHAWFLPFTPVCVSPSSASLVWTPDLP